MRITESLVVATCIMQTMAWSPSRAVRPRIIGSRSVKCAALTAADASATLAAAQAKTVAEICESLPELTEKADASWTESDGQTICGAPATLAAFDAPGRPNVAWMSSVTVEAYLCSLTVLIGPLTDVPHLVSRCALNSDDGTLSLFIDWRPRAYGAYEMRQEDGSYPGPDVLGREAFTYSGARTNMEKKFFTPDLEAFVASTRESLGVPDVQAHDLSPPEVSVRGPLAIDIRGVPLTEASIKAVVEARVEAAKLWLGWQLDYEAHAHRPGAPVNSQYVFDTPMKQNMYTSLLDTFTTDLFKNDSSEAAKLAAADSGPLDEAYVGGAS